MKAYELISNHQVNSDGDDDPIDLNLEVKYTKKHFQDPRDLDDVNGFNQEYEFEQEQETEIQKLFLNKKDQIDQLKEQ